MLKLNGLGEQIYSCIFNIVARDLPGGKRIRIINFKRFKTVLKDCKEF